MPRSRYEDLSPEYEDDYIDRRGGAYVSRKRVSHDEVDDLASRVLQIAAYILRALAYLAVIVVVASTFGFASKLPFLGSASGLLMTLTLPPLRGILTFMSPFGGVFRGDFAVTAVMLFALDWICMRISTSLR